MFFEQRLNSPFCTAYVGSTVESHCHYMMRVQTNWFHTMYSATTHINRCSWFRPNWPASNENFCYCTVFNETHTNTTTCAFTSVHSSAITAYFVMPANLVFTFFSIASPNASIISVTTPSDKWCAFPAASLIYQLNVPTSREALTVDTRACQFVVVRGISRENKKYASLNNLSILFCLFSSLWAWACAVICATTSWLLLRSMSPAVQTTDA